MNKIGFVGFFLWVQEGAILESRGSQASFIRQCFILTRRSYVNMSRDIGYYWLRLVIYIMLTICIGTIYFKVGHEFSAIAVGVSSLQLSFT
jgi:hypothetical protein